MVGAKPGFGQKTGSSAGFGLASMRGFHASCVKMTQVSGCLSRPR
jgi:hypothetical protein